MSNEKKTNNVVIEVKAKDTVVAESEIKDSDNITISSKEFDTIVNAGDNVIEVEKDKTDLVTDPAIEKAELTDNEETLIEEALETVEAEEVSGPPKTEAMKNAESNQGDLASQATDLLTKFKEYITSESFEAKCEKSAQKYGKDTSAVKSGFIKNSLGTIANVLNLTINITGNIVKSAVSFIEMAIISIVDFSASVLHKLVSLFTLNCGTVAY